MTKDALESAAWHVMAYVAGKRKRRELLEGPASCRVELTVAGKVAGKSIELPLSGQLNVNADGVRASSTGPSAVDILALALGRLSPRQRSSFCGQLRKQFADGQLPSTSAEIVEQAESLLKDLRTRVESPVKGSVSFVAV